MEKPEEEVPTEDYSESGDTESSSLEQDPEVEENVSFFTPDLINERNCLASSLTSHVGLALFIFINWSHIISWQNLL